MTSEPTEEGNNPVIYYQKGLDSFSLCKYEEAISSFNIAIEINRNESNYYENKGLALQGLGKDKEAAVCYDKAIEINPNNKDFHSKKVLTLQKLGKGQEAVDYYDRAIEIDPENIIFYEYKALALQRMGRDQEARVCLNKLEEKKRNKPRFHFSEGLTLRSQGKYEEAILEFDKAIEMEEKSAHFHFYKGLALISLNKDQEAVLCFERAIEIWPKNPLYYCVRGRTLRSLNKQQDALTDFKKTQEIGKSGEKIFLVSRSEIEHLTIIVNSILELQKDDEKAEKTQRQLDKNNPNIMKFVEDLKAFQVRKEKVITDLLTKIEEKYSGEVSPKNIHAVSQLRDDYQRLQKEIKEELSKEVDDFGKKFDVKVGDLDIGLDDQIRVKEYLKAFIGTFSFAFEGSQAIENENYQLDISCLFSTFASFAPFVRGTSGITSIGKFFSRKEIQRNAKKMLELFFDSSVYLNAMIGKTAEKIVLNQKKREHIVSITDKELDKISGNLLKKLSKFCKQVRRPMDINLYKELYNTPAARLGHMDANDLIQGYLKGKISPEKVQEEFVERTLKRHRGMNQLEADEIKIRIKKAKESGKEKCCNIF